MGMLSVLYDRWWWLALGGLVAVTIQKILVYARLSAFKGPPGSGWFELWHSSTLLNSNGYAQYKEVCDKYGKFTPFQPILLLVANSLCSMLGPIARIGPNDLITCSWEVLSHMSAVRSPYTRTPWFALATRSQPGIDNIFSELDEKAHLRRRQQMAPGVSRVFPQTCIHSSQRSLTETD